MWGWIVAVVATVAWFALAAVLGVGDIPAVTLGVCIFAGVLLAIIAWERGRQ